MVSCWKCTCTLWCTQNPACYEQAWGSYTQSLRWPRPLTSDLKTEREKWEVITMKLEPNALLLFRLQPGPDRIYYSFLHFLCWFCADFCEIDNNNMKYICRLCVDLLIFRFPTWMDPVPLFGSQLSHGPLSICFYGTS